LAVTHFMLREIEVAGGYARLIEPADPETIWRTLLDDGISVVFTLPLVASRLGEYHHVTRRHPPEGFKAVFCGGDVLSPARQAMLAQLWRARVLNMFGCSELFGPLAGPGEAHGPLRWGAESVAVEVLHPVTRTPCGAGDRGVLVLTTLWPKARPLLRYWTDDVVEIVHTAARNGEFSFHYLGRPHTMLTTAGGPVALRDLDDVLLGSGLCLSEWRISHRGDAVRIEAETVAGGTDIRHLADALSELLGAATELTPREPGSLPRTVPKFGVLP
jgi:phenylacetate-coenzyme A ligase PaaK-like adenylate-forming protein